MPVLLARLPPQPAFCLARWRCETCRAAVGARSPSRSCLPAWSVCLHLGQQFVLFCKLCSLCPHPAPLPSAPRLPAHRVWSVHHSVQRPHLCASASEDGTVRLWGDHALHSCIGVLRPSASGAPACGVRLSPFDANLAAVACADHSAYLYDLRRADRPLLQLAGHSRAVSYVRWLSASSLVTASTDATLALWQLPGPQAAAAAIAPAGIAATAGQLQAAVALSTSGGSSSSAAAAVLSQPFKRFRGHQNQKNFVGLAVRPEDGLLACGSEAPASYTYHTAWSSPLAVHSFGEHPGGSNGGSGGGGSSGSGSGSPSGAAPDDLFCSAVCWQPAMARPAGAPPLLATALSSGEVRVLELQRSVAAAAQRRCMDG